MSSVGAQNLKHIVVLMMENRSFDHMLGFLKTEDPSIRGIVGNDYSNPSNAGPDVPVTDGAQYQGQLTVDPGHDFTDVYMQMYGVPFGSAPSQPNMSGFAKSYEQVGGKAADIMRCFRPEQIPVVSTLAREYAICDQWFSSVPGPTLPNRAFAHFGTSFGRLDMSPDYFRAKPNIYQRLSKAGKKAMIYYYAGWSGTQGLTFLLSDQRKYFALWGDFVDDCKHNRLPDYSFVEPAYSDKGGILASDQHPDHSVQTGDNFIRQVYEAVRSNDDLWKSTLLLILWDEHGGIYDHEIPPMVGHTDGFVAPGFNFDRLGVRVPALVVSPYVVPGTVDHTVFEHASIPATVTEWLVGDPRTNAPYAREQFANTYLHLLTGDQPRTEMPDFAAPVPAVIPTMAAEASTPTVPTQRLSSLHQNLVSEVHQVLVRNHPDLAKKLDPAKVKTEQQATQFLGKAMSAIHPKTG